MRNEVGKVVHPRSTLSGLRPRPHSTLLYLGDLRALTLTSRGNDSSTIRRVNRDNLYRANLGDNVLRDAAEGNWVIHGASYLCSSTRFNLILFTLCKYNYEYQHLERFLENPFHICRPNQISFICFSLVNLRARNFV